MLLPLVLSFAALPLVAQGLSGSSNEYGVIEQPGLVRFPLAVTAGAPSKSRFRKRQGQADLTPQKHGFFYSIQIHMGTPPQAVSVNFDTGSDELWVNPVCGKSSDPAFCQTFGQFNGSQTFVDLKRNGSIQYGTGFANLEYGYDFVQIGSARVSQQIFGVATDSSFAASGILGVGPSLDGWNSSYPLVLDSMTNQGFINSRAFSLDLRSIESQRGSVTFGGIDTKKYSGHLEKRPIIPSTASPDGYTRYWVYLDGISVSTVNGSTVTILDKVNGQGILLDSGYTVSALPKVLFNKLKDAFPQVTKPPQGSDLWRVPCSVGNTNGHVDFKFGQTVIKVPFRDFIWKQPADGSCVLGAIPDDEFPVLGDTFLRAAYVVYDWDNRNIHLANNEDCGTNLVPIGKGPDAVPSIVGGCTPEATMPTNSSRPSATSKPPLTQTSGNHTVTRKFTRTLTKTYTGTSVPVMVSKAAQMTQSSVLSAATATFSSQFSSQTADAAEFDTMDGAAYTSTFTTTRTYTIASCPPHVANCPLGSVTTETSVGMTTWSGHGDTSSAKYQDASSSPSLKVASSSANSELASFSAIASVDSSSANPKVAPSSSSVAAFYNDRNEAAVSLSGANPNLAMAPTTEATAETTTPWPQTTPATLNKVTSIFVTTKTHTVTDCAGKASCTKGQVVTQVLTSTTYLCPESTATWFIPRTHTCTVGEDGCKPGQKITTTHVVTVVPVTTNAAPTPVPGCDKCRMPPPVAISPITVISPSPQTSALQTTPLGTLPYMTVATMANNTAASMVNKTATVPIKSAQGVATCATCVLETLEPSTVTAGAMSWRVSGVTALVMMAVTLVV